MEGGANNSSGNSSGVNVIIREDNLGLPREASILMGEPARERVRERERELTVYFEGAIKSVAVSGGSDKVDTPPPPLLVCPLPSNTSSSTTALSIHFCNPPSHTPFTPFTPPAQPPLSPPQPPSPLSPPPLNPPPPPLCAYGRWT